MSSDVGEVTESLENELCSLYCRQLCSFSKLSVTSPTSQLILQPFRHFIYAQHILQHFHRFTYVTAHSQTLPLLHLRHSSFSKHSFASPTSQALHLRHLASRPWSIMMKSQTVLLQLKPGRSSHKNMIPCFKLGIIGRLLFKDKK